MEWIPRIARRLRLLIRRNAVERSMDAEMRYHLECEIRERISAGMTAPEARRTALRDFGGIEAMKELARDARGGRLAEDLLRDVQYAARVLRNDPSYTLVAVVTLALAIAAVTAIFSLAYGVLLRPLPYPAPDRLVVVWERNLPKGRDRNVVSLSNYEAWRERARSFTAMAAVVPTSATLAGNGGPERLLGADVTAGYFSTLGVPPALGRDFSEADARHGMSVILGGDLWRRRFGGDPSIVGRPIRLSGKPYTVVGIMPSGFVPPRVGWLGEQDLWFPLVASPQARAWGRAFIVLARLRQDAPLDAARSEMLAIASARATEAPGNAGWSTSVVPLSSEMTGDVRSSVLVLVAAVGLLFLIAVSNVATLTIAAVNRRSHELAVRRAIGATDGRLFRQLFTQSAIVGTAGAVTGIIAAAPAVHLLVRLMPSDVPRPEAIAVDAPVLLASSLVSLVAAVVIGSGAALRRGRRAEQLLTSVRETGEGRASRRRGLNGLVAAEIAFGLALAVMAVLMARSFAGLRGIDLGFSPAGVVIGRVALPAAHGTPERQRLFFQELLERVRAVPGVLSAGTMSSRPLGGIGPATTAHDARKPADPDGKDPVTDVRYVDPHAFDALGIRIIRGTTFDARDTEGPPRVVISQSLARRLWPDEDPLGKRIALKLFDGIQPTVIGIVNDVHLLSARAAPGPVAFLAAGRFPSTVNDLIVRAQGDPEMILPSVRAVLASLDPTVPMYSVTTLSALVDSSLARDRLIFVLLVSFAVVALILSAVGVFGLFAGEVAARRREMGIRLLLGARRHGIINLLLQRAMTLVTSGVIGGVLLGLLAARGMESLLFGVRPSDPMTFAAAAALVIGIATGATLLPALRVLRESPLSVLREG